MQENKAKEIVSKHLHGLDLPKKKDGLNYLSYSQITTFKRSRIEYKEQYIDGKPFEGNEYTDFGTKVGEALEHNDFSKFTSTEEKILRQCERLDVFERKIEIDFFGFFKLIGYIDTCDNDFSKIIDYKTGGAKKELVYQSEDYTQIPLYAIGIKQETGILPTQGAVQFIRRSGNAFKGEKLYVANEAPQIIPVDISIKRLAKVYWDTVNTAKMIHLFYQQCRG